MAPVRRLIVRWVLVLVTLLLLAGMALTIWAGRTGRMPTRHGVGQASPHELWSAVRRDLSASAPDVERRLRGGAAKRSLDIFG